ncbi:hypothetical protein HOS33_gp086 [Erwinia phage vB_EamM_Y3]|uniref:Uncharacterized protein n=1 Tax=Erwinia phage vB_EamM_Y3 TaxID=1983553 RepID=A0A2H4IAZ8_9CAUD|nr:hypothetical protein HOS33_gp086 [Erwinia phage vB_EamM_Y3]ARW58726.1 hypothetical protein Y3_086 [Erwinia phage vB_EamM_Y3]
MFDGRMPTSKEGFAEVFNSRSLADLYNKSLGLVRSPVTGIENGNVIALQLQSQYIPKGVSYYGTIGTALLPVTQLMPRTIQSNAQSDRNISFLTSSGTVNLTHARTGYGDYVIEFDAAVTITHIKYMGTVSGGSYQLVRIAEDNTETATTLGTVLAGEANCYPITSPVASKKYRLKSVGGANSVDAAFVLLSSVDQAPSTPQTQPTWAALAHTNTRTHGDIDYSDEIMFAADACGVAGPFKIVGNIVPNKLTRVYCPKLRFTQRSGS